MRAVVLIALLVVAVLGEETANIDKYIAAIESIDDSVFNTESVPQTGATPLEHAAKRVAESEAELDADTESVAAIAEGSAATGGEDQTLYSFRAMKEATAMAGSSVTERSSETHAQAMRILNQHKVSADEMFAEINREQQILVAKRALVARQKQSITDSEESLARLKRVIDTNRNILSKNERALRRASDDLLRLISKYQSKLKSQITGEVGASSQSSVGEPLRSRPHQRAALLRKTKGQRIDSTKSAAANAALNKAKGKGKGKGKGKAPAKKAVKFAQVHDEAEAEAETETESADAESESEAEAESDESEEQEEESEEESDSSEAEGESESESESESEAESEEEESDEAESEDESEDESEEAFIEKDEDSYDPTSVKHEAVIAGLAAPPHLYNPETDSFV